MKTINFAVFEDFATALKINSSKSYYSIESYGSLVGMGDIYIDIPIYRYETYYHDTNIKICISIDAHACYNFNILMQ